MLKMRVFGVCRGSLLFGPVIGQTRRPVSIVCFVFYIFWLVEAEALSSRQDSLEPYGSVAPSSHKNGGTKPRKL